MISQMIEGIYFQPDYNVVTKAMNKIREVVLYIETIWIPTPFIWILVYGRYLVFVIDYGHRLGQREQKFQMYRI